jgi:hypothetical protein
MQTPPIPLCPFWPRLKNTLGPCSGCEGFVCDNVRRLLARARVIMGAIDVETVEVDIVDADTA